MMFVKSYGLRIIQAMRVVMRIENSPIFAMNLAMKFFALLLVPLLTLSCSRGASPTYLVCNSIVQFSPTGGMVSDDTEYLFRYEATNKSLSKLQVDGSPISFDVDYICSENELRISCIRETLGTSWVVMIQKETLEFEEATAGVGLKGDLYLSTNKGSCVKSSNISK